MKLKLLFIYLIITFPAFAQKEFFRSEQTFDATDIKSMKSSVTTDGNLVLFNACDYTLYAYNKKDNSLQWTFQTNYKSNEPVYIHGNQIFVAVYKNDIAQTAIINTLNGQPEKVLPFGPLMTKPIVKNEVLYGTALYDYGSMIAYDINKDSVIWHRFLAHGFSAQPYYFNDKIIANAEGDNWVDLDYNGKLMDTTCKNRKDIFIDDIHCVKNFTVLTHNKKEIKGDLAKKVFGEFYSGNAEIRTTNRFTYILNEDYLHIIGNKLRPVRSVKLPDNPDTGDSFSENLKFVAADDGYVWMLIRDKLVNYSIEGKKFIANYDLSAYQPHQLLKEGNNIWLISRKDGLLYGVSL